MFEKLFNCIILRYHRRISILRDKLKNKDDTIKELSRVIHQHFKEIKRLEDELQNRNN
jgi:uncharacterized coiled-coil protein SlyX